MYKYRKHPLVEEGECERKVKSKMGFHRKRREGFYLAYKWWHERLGGFLRLYVDFTMMHSGQPNPPHTHACCFFYPQQIKTEMYCGKIKMASFWKHQSNNISSLLSKETLNINNVARLPFVEKLEFHFPSWFILLEQLILFLWPQLYKLISQVTTLLNKWTDLV